MDKSFVSGVIEGFYGQPWTHDQRRAAITRLKNTGLNTYFYAPKDDLKHRAVWREDYDEDEISRIAELIRLCNDSGVHFIYGLSPGLDVRFSEEQERDRIVQRFAQLQEIGARWFALLFDDLPGEMNQRDAQAYSSVAIAQSDVTNRVFRQLKQSDEATRLFFCPTPYCDRMDRWKLGGDRYLDDLGENLDADVEVFWTGPEIVSEQIPVASIQQLVKRLKRKPIIWDNLYANDYDLRRLYCGPFSGRELDLRQHVNGFLINPNNEFPINEIAIVTLAKFVAAKDAWDPRAAYLQAIREWLSSYETIGAEVSLDDLTLLADCYYLPFQLGDQADELMRLIQRLLHSAPEDWGASYETFLAANERIQKLFDKLTQLRDRELFYAWSRRAWELKEEMDLVATYLQQRRDGADAAEGIGSESHRPETYRGGFVAKLQGLLPMSPDGKFFLPETKPR